jgi:hypothetical protein
MKLHGLTAVVYIVSGFRFVERNPEPSRIVRDGEWIKKNLKTLYAK